MKGRKGPRNPAARRGVGPNSGLGSRPQDGISMEQYAKGRDAFLAQQPFALIQARSQMTKPQILWCIREGDTSRGMPAWSAVLADQLAAKHQAAREAAELVSKRACSLIEAELDSADRAAVERARLLTLRASINDVLQRQLEEGSITAAAAIKLMTPSLAEVQALAALDKLATVGKAAESFRKTFDHPNARLDPLTGQPRTSRTPDAVQPAAATVLVDADRDQRAIDPLDAYFPQLQGMSLEESIGQLRRFIELGEVPRTATALPPSVIDTTVVDDDAEEPEDR
jgi:hypothetical protein